MLPTEPDTYSFTRLSLKTYDTKLEEDIISPHISKFSTSINFEQNQKPKFDNIEELRSTFPGLISHDLGHGKFLKVNNFEAKEISVKLGKIVYDNKKGNKKDDNKVTLFLNLWYTPKDESTPVIVELTYSYVAIRPSPSISNISNEKNTLIEEFPLFKVRNTYEFYNSLQKTEFAYTYKS